jgi:hypothetical protein
MDIQTLTVFKDLFMQNPAAVVGIIMPPLIDILNKDIPKEREVSRFIATFAICFATAIVFDFNKLMYNSWGELLTTVGIIFTESQVIYRLYFKNSYLRSKMLERIYDIDEPAVIDNSSIQG